MDNDGIIKAINKDTKAVFLTHVQGFNGLSDKLLKELSKRDIILIEDVCESHGATHNNIKLGSFGWASNFSFYSVHWPNLWVSSTLKKGDAFNMGRIWKHINYASRY